MIYQIMWSKSSFTTSVASLSIRTSSNGDLSGVHNDLNITSLLVAVRGYGKGLDDHDEFKEYKYSSPQIDNQLEPFREMKTVTVALLNPC